MQWLIPCCLFAVVQIGWFSCLLPWGSIGNGTCSSSSWGSDDPWCEWSSPLGQYLDVSGLSKFEWIIAHLLQQRLSNLLRWSLVPLLQCLRYCAWSCLWWYLLFYGSRQLANFVVAVGTICLLQAQQRSIVHASRVIRALTATMSSTRWCPGRP